MIWLQVLRSSPEADNSKLVAYAWQHVIPAAERLTVYKQLLGITGAYPDTRATIAKLREDEVHKRIIHQKMTRKICLFYGNKIYIRHTLC